MDLINEPRSAHTGKSFRAGPSGTTVKVDFQPGPQPLDIDVYVRVTIRYHSRRAAHSRYVLDFPAGCDMRRGCF